MFFIVALGVGGWLIWQPFANLLKQSKKKEEWSGLVGDCKYQHYHQSTGIAVNLSTRQIYLLDGDDFKKYDFSDVREWTYNLLTGGTSISNRTLAEGAHNHRQNKANEAGSGFFVKVKDIDRPEWRVAFPYSPNNNKKTELELKRWMEIFQQNINEK
ncbi:DUF4755 domain-containing protein [Methylobacillus flagellatus]|uniref:DUF4755 domain-containing protein n=1 Tax=Methylobacillus flagellatus TaxID=405 RepID=UPI00257018B5|nr:DUF4755 domain-containing protein [Methylobacillus flagellatus]